MNQPDVFLAADSHRHDHSLGEAVVGTVLTIEALLVGTYVAATLAEVPSATPLVALAVGVAVAALAVAATVAAGRRLAATVARVDSIVRSREARDDTDRRDDDAGPPVRAPADPHRR